MKTKITLLAVLVAAFFAGFGQQVPNGSFENWTAVTNPDGWTSVESANGLPSSFFTFEDTAHTVGQHSVKLVCDSISLDPSVGVVPAFLSLGGAATNTTTHQISFVGIPFHWRPDTVVFDFQYASPGLDTGFFQLALTKNFTDQVLGGGIALTPTAGNWIHVALPLAAAYGDANTPDTLQIQFFASASAAGPIKGSTLHVDGLRFGYATPPATLSASITAAGSTTVCQGDSVQLTANTGTNYTFQWNLGGTAVSGATGSSYYAKDSGSYTVVIDSAGTLATSNAILVKDSNCSVGISTIAATNLSVYPNPATTLLNVNSNENLTGFNLLVYDIVGRLVISQILEGSSNQINVAKLSNGTYIYHITDKDNNTVSQSKFNVIK